MSNRFLSRRKFLHGAGVALALPMLDAMQPVRLRGAAGEKTGEGATAGSAAGSSPARLVAINIPLGFIAENFFPQQTGRGYVSSSYLKPGEALRDRFTVFSGTSHPGVDGGHSAEKSFLTAAPSPGARTFRNTISLDQMLAEKAGDRTRFASLALGEKTLSWSANGVAIPAEAQPTKTFAQLFFNGTPAETAALERDLADGRSILDTVTGDAHAIERRVGPADRDKLDQFFTAVRETERRLKKNELWNRTPKPKVEAKPPPANLQGADLVGRLRAHFDVMRLALETDSTRIITYGGTGYGTVPLISGVRLGYHGLSHHGKNPDMLQQLALIEQATIGALFEFLAGLEASKENGVSLLDRTQVFLGSNLGNASGHLTTNLPILLAGGGYKHGAHVAFDAKNNYPLPKLFVSIAQRFGVETDSFAGTSGTMTGLE
jgi:hypothetical protein